jgi:hypothetical protein
VGYLIERLPCRAGGHAQVEQRLLRSTSFGRRPCRRRWPGRGLR